MRSVVVVALALLLTSSVSAQDTSQHRSRLSPPTETPFLEYVRTAAVRLSLADLREAQPGAQREVRLWHGFGLFGVELVIIREASPAWRAYTVDPDNSDSTPHFAPLPDTTDWGKRWWAAVNAGMLQLPPYPHRDPPHFGALDGYSAVLEWFDGTNYGIAGANNPDAFCSSDDRRIMAVLNALALHSLRCLVRN